MLILKFFNFILNFYFYYFDINRPLYYLLQIFLLSTIHLRFSDKDKFYKPRHDKIIYQYYFVFNSI